MENLHNICNPVFHPQHGRKKLKRWDQENEITDRNPNIFLVTPYMHQVSFRARLATWERKPPT
jgi:hypothetical protein